MQWMKQISVQPVQVVKARFEHVVPADRTVNLISRNAPRPDFLDGGPKGMHTVHQRSLQRLIPGKLNFAAEQDDMVQHSHPLFSCTALIEDIATE